MKRVFDPISQMRSFNSFLKRNEMKATPQRVAVQQAMMALVHASADMVKDWIGENNGTKVTSSSVYNILTQFSRMGLYGCRLSEDSKMYFDIVPTPHIHLYDKQNHAYVDVTDEHLYNEILAKIGSRRFKGYSVETIDVTLVAHPTKKSFFPKKK